MTIILLRVKRIVESSVADPDMGSGILDPVFFTPESRRENSRSGILDPGGGGGVLSCVGDHILLEFNTLFLTRFRTYKIARLTQTKT